VAAWASCRNFLTVDDLESSVAAAVARAGGVTLEGWIPILRLMAVVL
jgi:hypothetical protein